MAGDKTKKRKSAREEEQELLQVSKKPKRSNAENTEADSDALLLQSLASFLSKRGFSKTLSRFIKESQCADSWASCSIDIEDVFKQYKNQQSHKMKATDKENENGGTVNGGMVKDNGDLKSPVKILEEEVLTKEASKKSSKADDSKKKHKGKVRKLDDSDEKMDSKVAETLLESVDNSNKKKVKKGGKELISSSDPRENQETARINGSDIDASQKNEASAGGKSKKKKHFAKDGSDNNVQQNVNANKDENGRGMESENNSKMKETEVLSLKKSRKKKHHSEESDSVDKNKENTRSDKECKNKEEKSADSNGTQADGDQNTPLQAKNTDRDPENALSRTKDKSNEPTTGKAFQRVKLEKVEFSDPRLKDNSYWAKGGAEAGYGAKAQEVLEQVRGKNFRHEKTKKKRGSYRGGIIDLHSHSIKFNYSDEE